MTRPTARTRTRGPNNPQQTAYSSLSDADLWVKISAKAGVKRWRDASMALRWTSAAMLEAAKGFRRLKAHKQLSVLRAALAAHQTKHVTDSAIEPAAKAA
jgi:hypothetical protein